MTIDRKNYEKADKMEITQKNLHLLKLTPDNHKIIHIGSRSFRLVNWRACSLDGKKYRYALGPNGTGGGTDYFDSHQDLDKHLERVRKIERWRQLDTERIIT